MAADRPFEEYEAIADASLRRFADAPLGHVIAGARVGSESGATFENTSPVDGRLLCAVAAGAAAAGDTGVNTIVTPSLDNGLDVRDNGRSVTFCMRYNVGACTIRGCRFSHRCAVPKPDGSPCNGNHAAVDHGASGAPRT